jgi:phenylpropionate dioxygenase-like ring-hydroxylating dioxygenase large terminal subunit
MEEHFVDLDKSCLALKQVACDIWGGWVFINFNPKPRHTLQEWMKPMPEALERYFANEKWYWRAGYKEIFKCNWKILVDNQIEGYHVNSLHRPTITGVFSAPDMQTLAFPNSLGVPGKLEWCMPSEAAGKIKQTEVAQLAVKYGKDAPYTDKDKAKAFQVALDKYPGAVNRKNRPDWIFDDWCLFPNTVIFPQRDHMWIQRVWPLTPHETAWEWDWWFCSEPPKNFGERFSWEQAYLTLRNITTEDVSTVEGMQRTFRSGAVDGQILSELETSVRGFQQRVLKAVEDYETRKGRGE